MDADSAPPAEDAAEALKLRLREDLRIAMRARAAGDTAVLRALIAALDNAQAVQLPPGHQRYVEHAFGDRAAEVPRLRLDAAAVRGLLEDEARSREDAADEFDRLGRPDRAAELRAQAAIVARYLAR